MVADTVQKILEGTILWEIDGTGKIHADMLMEKDPEFPVLPRFGIRLFLEKGMEEVAYFGMGPQEPTGISTRVPIMDCSGQK